jgi:hypothetical protein
MFCKSALRQKDGLLAATACLKPFSKFSPQDAEPKGIIIPVVA